MIQSTRDGVNPGFCETTGLFVLGGVPYFSSGGSSFGVDSFAVDINMINPMP